MDAFETATDIGNRACDHWGALPIDPTLGFSETSKAAQFCSRNYDKLRQAELRANYWKFALKTVVLRPIGPTTMLLTPVLWGSTTTYFRGSIVTDAGGHLWISNIPNNLGNQPEVTAFWDEYFGPLTVSLFDPTTTYSAGELVYTAAGDGTNRVYLSLISANADVPSTATAYSATVTYFRDQIVTYLTVPYKSLIDLSINQTPSASPANWAVGTTYAINNLVNGTDGVTYKSLGNGNVGHNPVTDGGVNWQNTGVLTPWTSVFVGGTGSLNWLQIGGAEFPNGVTLQTLNTIYPLGAGPSDQDVTRNAFRLPAAFLRRAPDNQNTYPGALGGPTGIGFSDWNFEGRYITSGTNSTITLRFVADLVDVTQMDPMFCEGLGLRLALEGAELVTQSGEKQTTIASKYKKFRTDAAVIDGIERGEEEQPDDEYVTVRL